MLCRRFLELFCGEPLCGFRWGRYFTMVQATATRHQQEYWETNWNGNQVSWSCPWVISLCQLEHLAHLSILPVLLSIYRAPCRRWIRSQNKSSWSCTLCRQALSVLPFWGRLLANNLKPGIQTIHTHLSANQIWAYHRSAKKSRGDFRKRTSQADGC